MDLFLSSCDAAAVCSSSAFRRRGSSPLQWYRGWGTANGIGRERDQYVVQKIALLQLPDEDFPQLLVRKALDVKEEEAGTVRV